jgi:hypothetical protein
MTTNEAKRGRLAIDHWARERGYHDYDTYIRTGGSVADAAQNIRQRINTLLDALHAITAKASPEPMAKVEPAEEPPDPDNAHIQGADG